MYVANVTYEKTPYMEESEKFIKQMTINAYSYEQAEEKVREYFDSKSDPYGVYYRVISINFWTHLD